MSNRNQHKHQQSYNEQEELGDELDCDTFDSDEFENDNPRRKSQAGYIWMMSTLVHAILIGSLVYFLMPAKEKPADVVITTSPIPLEEEKEEEKEIDIVKEKVEVEVEVEVEMPPVVTEEVVEDNSETENDMEDQTAEGVSEAISDQPLVGSGVMGNIGGGGGGGGAFGQRSAGGRKRAVLKGGGSKQTESAVDLGLWWLAHHQEADGHWSTGKYEGDGSPAADSGSSAAAVLAFLGAGHTDKVGKWKKNVRIGVAWIVKVQNADGSFPGRNYSNGMCTMALAEATGMGVGGSKVKKAAELAVDYLIKQQNPKGGYDYKGPSARDDMSVTGWCVMGLKSAMVSGIRVDDVKNVFQKVGLLLDHKENAKTTADNTSSSQGRTWYTSGLNSSPACALGAIAMLIRQYLGWHRSEPWLAANSSAQITRMPNDFNNMSVYRTYYAYLALFQQGGDAWKKWNKHVSPIIVKAQRQDGDFKGSWDTKDKFMARGGRVLTTAFLVLSLEVYYRYKSVMSSH